ncbi:MAG: hypothetical protein JXA43_01475, partial [Candidatus Diapherotrites archaeon]|nr:hypothetical protein [Candidatus Diapherotrites archaeon]
MGEKNTNTLAIAALENNLKSEEAAITGDTYLVFYGKDPVTEEELGYYEHINLDYEYLLDYARVLEKTAAGLECVSGDPERIGELRKEAAEKKISALLHIGDAGLTRFLAEIDKQKEIKNVKNKIKEIERFCKGIEKEIEEIINGLPKGAHHDRGYGIMD